MKLLSYSRDKHAYEYRYFLDQALTTTDTERSHKVASSIINLIKEVGQQIFYLCAQPTDVQLWERNLGRLPHVIDSLTERFGLTVYAWWRRRPPAP